MHLNSANLQLPDPASAAGPRFEFGKNWQRFLNTLDERRIAEAERSLREMLDVTDLAGKSFLDVGSGSGLFSLAARRLGARVCSFDLDPHSVACTAHAQGAVFRRRPAMEHLRGSVLDRSFLDQLGTFDVVYAWGVLHHTGAMWQAIGNVLDRVGDRRTALHRDLQPSAAVVRRCTPGSSGRTSFCRRRCGGSWPRRRSRCA